MFSSDKGNFSGGVVLPLAFLDVGGSEKTTPLSTEAMQLYFATVALVRGLRGEGGLTVRTPLNDPAWPHDTINDPAWPHDITIVDEAPDLGLHDSYTGGLSNAPAVTEVAQNMTGFGENGKKFTTTMRELATAAFDKLNESDPSTLKRVFTAPLIGFDLPEKPPRK